MSPITTLHVLREQLTDSPEHADGVAALGDLLCAVDAWKAEAELYRPVEAVFLGGPVGLCSPMQFVEAFEQYSRKHGAVEDALDRTLDALRTLRDRLAGILDFAEGVAALSELIEAAKSYDEAAERLGDMEVLLVRRVGEPRELTFTADDFMLARERFREANRRKEDILLGES